MDMGWISYIACFTAETSLLGRLSRSSRGLLNFGRSLCQCATLCKSLFLQPMNPAKALNTILEHEDGGVCLLEKSGSFETWSCIWFGGQKRVQTLRKWKRSSFIMTIRVPVSALTYVFRVDLCIG